MSALHVELPLQNEGISPIKILLEPLSEYFMIQPAQEIVIHGICDDKTQNRNFTIAPNDGFLAIYAPGEISGFIDCYATHQDIRLIPDGN
jgi:hypothetical protein